MKFTPRLTRPEAGNKYYITKSKGGYSTAIVGKPTDSKCNVLSNCFSGDTKIVTRDGVVRLDSIEGKDVFVLSKDGVYRPAHGEYFGKQHMYKVKFSNGDEFVCTGNHRWYVCKRSTYGEKKYEKYIFKTTLDLKHCDLIPYNKIKDTSMDRQGIINGFIYGDGSYYNGYRHSQANLCGKKKDYMIEYFEDAKHTAEKADGTIIYYPYPKEYKSIPDISENLSYLRGFIAGLIASDGCVDQYGCPSISTVKYADAKAISNILSVLGYRNHIKKTVRDTNYKENSTLYLIVMKKSFLPFQIFLNPEHQQRFMEKEKNISFIKVVDIIDLGYEEDAYCVQEPETHTMTLEGGILTGQCVGYAFGRFNEILGDTKMTHLLPVNAENFYAVGKSQGLKVGSEPKLGAVAVWAKGIAGNKNDGAGHVAIVEQINADGSIVTSESGYNCKNPFWTKKRVKGNGNWGQSSSYKFLGFVYLPTEVESTSTSTPAAPAAKPSSTTSRTIQKGDKGDDVKLMQQKLAAAGYLRASEADGIFGKVTLGALVAFQLENNLGIDAKCGPATKAKLGM